MSFVNVCSRLEGPIGTFIFIERGMPTWLYVLIWSALSWGIWMLLYLQLRALKKSIISATEQQLVQMVIDGRLFFIDHPELAEQEPDTSFEHFIADTGGWGRYFLRRNIISTLELLYFQRKAGAIEKGFFVSHCNHIRPWFENQHFATTWERSRDMHVPEFRTFVERLLTTSAEAVDPWKSGFQQFRNRLTSKFDKNSK
jgi:hypothetical protein